MTQAVTFLTPVGRLVAGDCFEGQTTDAEGNALTIKSGPNAGQPRVDYFLGLAIAKNDPQWPELHAKILQVARASFPHLFDAAGNCIKPDFAFKITDGDSIVPNSRNVRPCDKEGYPGHWVIHLSSGFAPKCYTKGGASLIVDKDAIKRGYYIRVYGSVNGNGSTQRPGVFLNHSMVEFIAYGDEITSGPSGESVFGAAPVATLPPGASAMPTAPATPIAQPVAAPAAPVGVGAGVPSPVVPAAGVAAPVVPVAPVVGGAVSPAPDFLNPPAAPDQYMVNGTAYTRAQLTAAGWTDAQIDTLLPF